MNTLSPQSSTSPSLGNATLHSGLETPRKLALPTTTREIELQYIVPEAIGSKLTKKHTPVHLTTHYFPKGSEVVEQIVKKSNLSGISDVLDIQNLNTVRLRQSIFSSGRNEYRLEFKGPKENCLQGGRIARPEFSFHIDQQLFATLLPEASAGLIVKLRYGIPGYIFKPDETRIPILLELDHVLKAGAPAEKLSLALYRADIEIPCTSLVDEIRKGRTTFAGLLKKSIELSTLDHKKARELSYSKLAKHGLSDEIRRLYQQLLG